MSHPSASSSYFKATLDAAATRTYRLASRFGLSPADREDLQQEIILDLLEHESQFDPTKGCPNTYTGVVSHHRAVELLDRLIKDRTRLCFFGTYAKDAANDPSIDDPDPTDTALVPLWADDQDLFADSDTLHDLQTAVSFMSPQQRGLLGELQCHQDLPLACQASGASPASFYRRVTELKMHLRMFGLRAAA